MKNTMTWRIYNDVSQWRFQLSAFRQIRGELNGAFKNRQSPRIHQSSLTIHVVWYQLIWWPPSCSKCVYASLNIFISNFNFKIPPENTMSELKQPHRISLWASTSAGGVCVCICASICVRARACTVPELDCSCRARCGQLSYTPPPVHVAEPL